MNLVTYFINSVKSRGYALDIVQVMERPRHNVLNVGTDGSLQMSQAPLFISVTDLEGAHHPHYPIFNKLIFR